MDFATITIITCISTLTFYLLFLLVGIIGIRKNTEAQGLYKESDN